MEVGVTFYTPAMMFLSQIELAENRIDHVRAVRRDGIAVEREGFVELVFSINGADIDDDVLLVVFFDFFVGGFFRPEEAVYKQHR